MWDLTLGKERPKTGRGESNLMLVKPIALSICHKNLVKKAHFSLDINQLLWLLKKVKINKNQLFLDKKENKTKLI